MIVHRFSLAPRRGLEPPAYRLTAECSTIELSRNISIMTIKLAPRRGLEPPAYRLTAECSTIELSRNVITLDIISALSINATLFLKYFKYSSIREKNRAF